MATFSDKFSRTTWNIKLYILNLMTHLILIRIEKQTVRTIGCFDGGYLLSYCRS